MYSRNISFDNSASGMRLTSNLKNEKPRERIPVKSFSDSFAYERFNRMGSTGSNTEKTEPKMEETVEVKAEMPVPRDNGETQYVEQSENNAKPNEIQKEERSTFSVLSRLKEIIDSDTVLILLAAIMILFSENATNDKLTPLALLAILFL